MSIFFSFSIILTVNLIIFKFYLDEKIFKFLLIASVPALQAGLMQYITVIRILISDEKVHFFYRKLSRFRSQDKSKDIRETWSHLREHSNGIFIMVLEVSVTCLIMTILLVTVPVKWMNNYFDVLDFLYFFLSFFLFWSIPSIFLWSRANNIEKDFVENFDEY